jgi:hypothetical protein
MEPMIDLARRSPRSSIRKRATPSGKTTLYSRRHNVLNQKFHYIATENPVFGALQLIYQSTLNPSYSGRTHPAGCIR